MKKILVTLIVILSFQQVNSNAQIINTIAGTGLCSYNGDSLPLLSACLGSIAGITVDHSGVIYYADAWDSEIRKVDLTTGLVTNVAGDTQQWYGGDGGPATSAQLNQPWGVAIDDSGNIFIADAGNHRLRKVTASTGIITTICGNGIGANLGDGGYANTASLWSPASVVVDSLHNIFISCVDGNVVRKIDAVTGLISTVAGNGFNAGTGSGGYAGDGGQATAAELNTPFGICVDPMGNLYIADAGNHCIRMVNASTGVISTIAGTRNQGTSGDGGLATLALLDNPMGIALDHSLNLYIADNNFWRVRKVNLFTGIIQTVAGDTFPGFTGDGGPAVLAEVNNPAALAVDYWGNLFIGDYGNGRIREIYNACYSHFLMQSDTATAHLYHAVNQCYGAAPLHYTWSWGDGSATDTAAYPSHTYAAPGYYLICVSIVDNHGCTSSYCDSSIYIQRHNNANTMITVDVVPQFPAVVTSNDASAITVYPNPVSSFLTINGIQAGKIELTDITGKVLLIQTATSSLQIDMQGYQAGVYILKTASGVKKIIKL